MTHAHRTVLFLHPSAELYGADQALLHLVSALDRTHWRAVVALPRRGPLAEALEAAGARVEVIELGIGARHDLRIVRAFGLAWRVFRGARNVRAMIRAYAPDVVHSNTLIVLGGVLGAWSSGTPHVWHVHEILERPRWLARAFAALAARAADVVVANSHATAACLTRHCARLAARTRVVENGIAGAHWTSSTVERLAERARLGLATDEVLVLLVGRVNSWKGQGLFLAAAQRLAQRGIAGRFLCVGDAPPGQEHFALELDALIAQAGFGERFQRAPFRPDVGALYAAADICVVPSTQPEPFGLVAVEAMAAERPVVAADHGGLAEIVEHEVTGLRFPPGDSQALADALERLIRDPALRARLGAAGRVRQRTRYDVARYAAELGAIHAEVAGGAPVAADPHTTIVHVVLGKANPDRPNGVNRFVDQLARAQVRAGRAAQVWGVTETPNAPTPPRPYSLRLFTMRGRWGRIDPQLRRALAELAGPAVIHLHGGLIPAWTAVSRAARRAGHRVVLSPHGAYRVPALEHRARGKRLLMACFDRRTIGRCEAVHALVEREAREMERWVDTQKIVIVPSGQDALERGTGVGRERRGERPIFGFLGRLDAHTKGLDVLIDAFALHVARGGPGQLVLAGEGGDAAELQQRIERAALSPRARLVGGKFGANKHSFLEGLDAFVHPSRHEGMPGAVLEAAALERALIVSEGTNLGDWVRANGAGLVVANEDAAALADALAQAAEEHAAGRLSTRGRRARAMVAECFDWRRIEATIARELYCIVREDVHGKQCQAESARPEKRSA